jgi:hypothetical protein
MKTAGKTNAHKRKRVRKAGAKGQRGPTRKARSAASAPLKASNEAKKRQTSLQQHPAGGIDLSAGFGALGLMNRRALAYFELPARIARCRSPLELWSVQAHFVQECLTEYTQHASTLLRGPTEKAKYGVLHN